MSGLLFRADVFAEVITWVAQHPTVQAFYENGPVPDLERVSDVWIDSEIRWYGAKTVAMGERPRGRSTGALMVRVYCREGSGTRLPDVLCDELEELFRPRRIGGAVFDFPERLTPTEQMGWAKVGILAPFYLDRV